MGPELNDECLALLDELERYVPLNLDLPEWLSPFTRRVLTQGALGAPSLANLRQERADLKRWLAEIEGSRHD